LIEIFNNQKGITNLPTEAIWLIAEIFALMSALTYALGIVSIRKRLDESSFTSVTVVISIIGAIIFWILVPVTVPLNTIDVNGILLFVLSGALAPGFARLLYFKGMKELGASINTSIVATNPMISSLVAVFLLAEHPTPVIWIGMLTVTSGVIMVGRSIHQGDTATNLTKFASAYPLVTACFAGLALVARKMALNVYSEPVMGVAIGYLTSLFIYLFLLAFSSDFRGSTEISKRTLQLFWKGGLCWCLGQLCSFYALRYGDVSIVAPILNIDPLFVLLFAHLFLKKLEKVSSLLLIGTVTVVIGISLITIF